MKPINAEEIVRVFNGWLEEADSLAEREAIECCIDHIQDAPAVSQQELRSYMLPWFSPFAAPWCGKIQRAFPKAYVTMNFELILVPRTNTYINLNHCSTPDEFKAEVIEGVSRFAFKAFTKPLCKEPRRHQQAARHQIHAGGHGVHLHQPRQRHQPRAVHEVCQERV